LMIVTYSRPYNRLRNTTMSSRIRWQFLGHRVQWTNLFVHEHVEHMLARARNAGLPKTLWLTLKAGVKELDVWRVEFGPDPRVIFHLFRFA
jgi:hypothetical protein